MGTHKLKAIMTSIVKFCVTEDNAFLSNLVI